MSNHSIITIPADGSTDVFQIPFPYILKEHIKVYFNDILYASGEDSTKITWLTTQSIKLASIPTAGTKVKIRRETEITKRLVDFQDTAVLDEATLDIDSNQLFYLTQEALDTANWSTEALDAAVQNTADYALLASQKAVEAQSNASLAQQYAQDTQQYAQDTLRKYEEIGISVKDFGAIGDGVQDDTIAIQNALNSKEYGTVYFPDGNYLISSILTVTNHSSLQLSKNARIFTNNSLDVMLSYNPTLYSPDLYHLSRKPFIKGGIFDANHKARDVIRLSQYLGFKIEDVAFRNFLEKGLVTRSVDYASAEGEFTNLRFESDQPHIGSIAIYNNGRDNIFDTIFIIDIETGIWTDDGIFSCVHHWIQFQDLIPNSCMLNIQDSWASFSQCYADTLRYPIKLAPNKHTKINDLLIIFNTSVYTQEKATTYPIVLFSGDPGASYYVQHAVISCYHSLKMCEYPFELSRFVDCKIYKAEGVIIENELVYNARQQLKGHTSVLKNDFDNVLETQNLTITEGDTISHAPLDAFQFGTLTTAQSQDLTTQIYVDYRFDGSPAGVYFRNGKTNAWTSWTNVNKVAEADPNDTITVGTSYSQSVIQAIIHELHDLKDKMRAAGLIAT